MTINETTRSGILIFQTLGKLDATSAPEAEKRIAELVNGGVRQIVMDLSGLDYISSAGLRFLLTSARRLQKAEGGLVVAAPSAQANQVIQMAGFSGLIPILDTVDAAIGSMKPLSQVSAGSPAQAQAASQATPTIGFAEEIYLLALDERKGIIKSVSVASLDYALAGALLMELAIRNRIDADLSIMKIISTASTGDPLLDNAMWLLALERRSTHEARPISFWLGVLAEESRQIQEHVLEQLVRKGILKQENRKILWVFEMKRYPITDDREVKEVRTRLRELILSDEVPEPRDVVLLNLGQSCRLLDDLFTAEEFERVYPRIEALMRLDLIGQEMTRTIRSIERSIAEAMSTSVMF
jgi:anti-anti-sigma factor